MKELKEYRCDFLNCNQENYLRVIREFIIHELVPMKGRLVKVTCLVDTKPFENYSKTTEEIRALFRLLFNERMPALTFVAQAPLNAAVGIETICFNDPGVLAFETWEDIQYVKVDAPNAELLYIGGIVDPRLPDAKSQAMFAFEKMDALLKKEGFEWNQVVRQWNYIEAITEMEDGRQRYQIFNDVRAKYYETSQWERGYPAATGIGMEKGGIVIDAIAVKSWSNNGPLDYPLANPLQVDAHQYSQQVLEGSTDQDFGNRQTPKFERAKALKTGRWSEIFVSGTAAIVGENTVPSDQPGEQTNVTIKNIRALISPENMNASGVAVNENGKIKQLRVYVKHPQDFDIIRTEVDKAFPDAKQSYVLADVCREELLVEIEAMADFT
ncbi:MAG: hypothetical protein MI784_13345 [Cytophagales bacterium]|nr:hypothetical protein [Cytophagales bacterium]